MDLIVILLGLNFFVALSNLIVLLDNRKLLRLIAHENGIVDDDMGSRLEAEL